MKRSSRHQGREPLLFKELRTPKEIFRHLRNHLAGQHVGATRDDVLLDEVLKCLFCKHYVEVGLAPPLPETSSSVEQASRIKDVFILVRRDYPDLYAPDTEIRLDPESLCFVMAECSFSLLEATSDPIGDAFEVFAGSESRGRAGQFFTPRPVTDLLVEALDPKPGETVIDPACGAGGFLTSVARHYLAVGVKPAKLASLSSKTLYGIDKDSYLVKLAKLHMSLLAGGHPQIVCADSVAMRNGSIRLRDELPPEGFDVLLTNPPFGTRIVAATPDVLRTFELGHKWQLNRRTGKLEPTAELQTQVPPQVLFVERCLSLLKEGGRMGMVLPESVLSNKSYRYVMEYLLEKSDVCGVVGMPEALFKTSGKGGTHTKTCILIVTKLGEHTKRTETVFMAEAKWCGHDSRARVIPNNDLPVIAENLRSYLQGRAVEQSSLGFVLKKEKLSSSILCPHYYDPQLDSETEALAATHDLLKFGVLVRDGILSLTTGDELGKLAYGTGEIPFVRTSDLSNWEIKADPKHGVDRKLYESIRGKQDVRPYDVLMVKDGTYLVGTCAIVTTEDRELIYQSHIYKIRVETNSLGLNPFLLLAALGSSIVQRQIKSKQFTQDIIDSLGERIRELILPIPKTEQLRQRITTLVNEAVFKRVEARRLAREARDLVASPKP
jgi:type I restriction enzyme M protein